MKNPEPWDISVFIVTTDLIACSTIEEKSELTEAFKVETASSIEPICNPRDWSSFLVSSKLSDNSFNFIVRFFM